MIVDVVLIVAVAVAFFSLGWCVTLNQRLREVENALTTYVVRVDSEIDGRKCRFVEMTLEQLVLSSRYLGRPAADFTEPAGKPESSKPHGAAVQFEDYR